MKKEKFILAVIETTEKSLKKYNIDYKLVRKAKYVFDFDNDSQANVPLVSKGSLIYVEVKK